MKSKLLTYVSSAGLVFGLLALSAAPVKSQKTQLVVDEVVAQVNDDIITLSQLRSESKRQIELLVKMGRTREQATHEVATRRDQLISLLINDLLLVQKGKELELSAEVEDEVAERLKQFSARQTPPPDKTQLDDMRVTLRTDLMKQAVFAKEVDSVLFFDPSLEELQSYFSAHQDQFRKPEVVTLSEIFLSSAGKDDAQVKAKAQQLVVQLRAGAIFTRLAAANSEREERGTRLAPTTGGKVGTFQVTALRGDIAAVVEKIKVGAISDPIRTDDGYQILRVDDRIPPGNSPFNENRVREAMTIERSGAAHAEYLRRLRAEAYVEIAKEYQSVVTTPR